MEKINFTDTVETSTPYVTIDGTNYDVKPATYEGGTDLNAQTFNTMQDNIENAINEKNIMFATNSSGYTTIGTSAEIVPLEMEMKIGNKLSISADGGVLIGKGVSMILANAQLSYEKPSVENGRYSCYIYKNSSVMCNSVFRSVGVLSYQSVCCPNVLIEVKEGDVIYLKARSQDGAGAMVFDGTKTNFLTVEVVK